MIYRKKAVCIEAVQLLPENLAELEVFCGDALSVSAGVGPFISTLEGLLHVSEGDYIIKGVKGEFYPCKPDIFALTYEQVGTQNLSFGQALEALELGRKVAREGWNGKGMYLWLLPAATITRSWIKDPMLLEVYGDRDDLKMLGSIRMRTAGGEVLTGWLASQTDMLAKDWLILD